jgi:aspartyl protease family protein
MNSLRVVLTLLAIILISLQSRANSSPRIQVNAILKNAAVLTINGKQQMLGNNASTAEGYKVINIGQDSVTLLINNEPQVFKLGAAISASKAMKSGKQSVNISRDNRGMYITSGTINNFPVNFLVDTGATFIAINSKLAIQIGIDYHGLGKAELANTASGQVTAWKLLLDSVRIGDLELRLVDAAVIEGDFPIRPLLGMSFLGRVRMQDNGVLLTIEEKY